MEDVEVYDNYSSSVEDKLNDLLLVELLKDRKAEIFENVVFFGKRRFYIEDLTLRDYALENTTPYQIQIDDITIADGRWGSLLQKLTSKLLEKYPNKLTSILNFTCDWSKQLMFSSELKTNYKEVQPNLYINCNHTALHSCWFLQDLLDFFSIDKSSVYFLIHRPSGAEPKKIKEYIEKRFKRDFIYFLINNYKKDNEYAEKVIRVVDKYLNPILSKISKSYVSFYLFDNNVILYNYAKKVTEYIDIKSKFDLKQRRVLKKYLEYICEYYK